MSYATIETMSAVYDVRRLQQLVSDSSVPATLGELADHPVLQQMLDEAADLILAACLVGRRYTSDDLDTLAASTTTGFLLRRLNSDLAYGLLACRRGVAADQVARTAPMYLEALRYLDQLRTGEILFPHIRPLVPDMYPAADLPKTADLNDSRTFSLPSDNVRLFGVRPGQSPGGYCP